MRFSNPLRFLAKARRNLQRRDFILARINPATQRGLEIGPLNRPVVKPTEGRIAYADHLPTEALRRKYADDPLVDVDGLVPISHVWGEATLPEAVGGERFDYVIASHVIEHVPDMIGWLDEVAEVLHPGGMLSLVIPDKRWTFDCLRQPTAFADLFEAFVEKRRRPCLRQVVDHFWEHTTIPGAVTTADLWAGRAAYDGLVRAYARMPGEEGLVWLKGVADTLRQGGYIDAHCQVFTPFSFVELLGACAKLGLVKFSVAFFQDTAPNEIEFFATLKRLPDDQTADARLAEILASLPVLAPPLLDGEVQALRQARWG